MLKVVHSALMRHIRKRIMLDFGLASDQEICQELCARLRAQRLSQRLGQDELAGRANIGLATLQRMESGKGGTLSNFLRVVMALGLADELANLFVLKVRSIAQLEQVATPSRKRAPSRRKAAKPIWPA